MRSGLSVTRSMGRERALRKGGLGQRRQVGKMAFRNFFFWACYIHCTLMRERERALTELLHTGRDHGYKVCSGSKEEENGYEW